MTGAKETKLSKTCQTELAAVQAKKDLQEIVAEIGQDAAYDEAAKELLANKLVLAMIMQGCVEEFQGCSTYEIVEKYIEEGLEIGAGPKIRGVSTEESGFQEGTVRFDIRFRAKTPVGSDFLSLIINVEAQNRFNPGYPLQKRALYYCCRMIAGEKGREFTGENYEGLKKVYSIWICANPAKLYRGTIESYRIAEEGDVKSKPETYDLLRVVMLCLGEKHSNEAKLIRFLEVLLSVEKGADEKLRILREKFGIEADAKLKGGMEIMCNLSQGILEKGIREGLSQGRQEKTKELAYKMYSQKRSLHEIAEFLEVEESQLKEWLEEK